MMLQENAWLVVMVDKFHLTACAVKFPHNLHQYRSHQAAVVVVAVAALTVK
jgi:hypothetical protein